MREVQQQVTVVVRQGSRVERTTQQQGELLLRLLDVLALGCPDRLVVPLKEDRLYGYLLRESVPAWIYRWVDGALLVDLWDELDLPDPLRKAWQTLIDDARNGPIENPIYVGADPIQKLDRDERKERIASRRAAAKAAHT